MKTRFAWMILSGALAPLAGVGDPLPTMPPAAVVSEPLMETNAPAVTVKHRIAGLMGAEVSGRDGQDAGKLSDVVFDMRDGRVAYGVIKTLEDERRIAVPAELLTANLRGDSIKMGCTQQKLRAAPDFAKSDLQDPKWQIEEDGQFGVNTTLKQIAAGSVINEPAGAEVSASPARIENQPQPGKQLVRLSDLVGGAVRDRNGQPVGDIKDVAVDWGTKQMTFVMLDPSESTGGIENRYRDVAIAPNALEPTPGGGGFVVNATKAEMAGAPNFDRALAPLATDSAFVNQVNLYYGSLH